MAFTKGIYMINGVERIVIADAEKETVADVLRRIGLTGVKVGCGTGQCGSCTVLIDGKPVRSCVKKWKSIKELTEIETIEGIGTASAPHALQLAWVKYGAVQCGFCTPGFIMSAKSLLAQNASPSRKEVRDWFTKNHNSCRCTGYKQIVDAVMAAAEVMRGEKPMDSLRGGGIYDKAFNGRYPRPSALAKTLGVCDFGKDMSDKMPDGALQLAIVWPEYAHAKILGIDFSDAEKMEGVVKVLTAKDVKGTNSVASYSGHKRSKHKKVFAPVLAADKVMRIGDPVALVVADTEEHARQAAKCVKVDYEPLPVYRTAIDASQEGAVRINEDAPNVFSEAPLFKGEDTRKIFVEADKEGSDIVSVSGSFYTTPEPHLSLEPVHAQAFMDEDGMLTMMYKDQAPHFNAMRLSKALGYPAEKIRVVMNASGSSFGYSMNPDAEALCGLACIETGGRATCLNLTYAESQTYTGKRSVTYVNGRLAADKKTGKMLAMEMHGLFDVGAHAFKGPDLAVKCLSFIGVHYDIPNIRGLFECGFSNRSPIVQYRGYGAPQIYTSSESLVDMMAAKLGMDPFEFRKRNIVHEGDTQPHGSAYTAYPHQELMDLIAPKYQEALKWKKEKIEDGIRRGVGVSFGGYHVSFPGGDFSEVDLEVNPDNTITNYNGWPEMGQCADVGALGIAANELEPYGIKADQIKLYMDDTKWTPNTGPAGGSRCHMMCSMATHDAAEKLIALLKKEDGTLRTYDELVAEGLPTRVHGRWQDASTTPWNENDGSGKLPLEMNYLFYVTRVEVDEEKGKVTVCGSDFIVDCGTVGNFNSTDGQAFGGLMHSIGYALTENYNDYEKKYQSMIPCGFIQCNDMPDDINVMYHEVKRDWIPNGCAGVSEGFQSGGHVSVLNAIYDAVGVRITELPATPDKVLRGLAHKNEQEEYVTPKYNWNSDFNKIMDYIKAHPIRGGEEADIDSI